MSVKGWLLGKAVQGKLPNWVYRFVGRKIADKMGLEDYMEEGTDFKSKWKSKTVWVAIIGVVLAAVQPISTALGYPIIVPDWVYQLLAGMGLYSLRTATTDVK